MCLYSKNVCFYVFITNKFSNLLCYMFHSKRVKISNIIILHVQSNPMSYNIRVLIKIYYICPILYLLGRSSREYTLINLVHFDSTFLFQYSSMDEFEKKSFFLIDN